MKPTRVLPKLLVLLFLLGALAKSSAAPTNDLFGSRVVISGTNLTIAGNNSGAGNEAGEDIGGGNIYRFYSVWYSWTAPTNGVLHLSGGTTAANFFMSVRTYRGSAVDALTLAESLPDDGVPVTTGDTVAIQVASIYYPVWSGGGGTGPFTLSLALETPGTTSANDAFTNRAPITAAVYHFEGSIYGATSEPGEPLPGGTSQTLWWKFVAPESGVLNVTPSTPQFSPALRMYEGATLGTLVPIAPVNNTAFSLEAGHEYALQMAAGYVPGGAFVLDTRFFSLTNDIFASSTHLEGTNFTYIGNLTQATLEPGEPIPAYTNTIWISWAPPFSGRARITGTVVAWAQPLAVFSGPTASLLTPIRTVGLANNRYDFMAIAGAVYHIQICGDINIAPQCNMSLQLFPEVTAPNDFFAGARLLAGQTVNQGIDPEWSAIGSATSELGEPAHLPGSTFKSLWWKWVAPVHGTARFYGEKSLATNVVLAAYKGSSVAALTLLAKGTDATGMFSVTGGETYYLAGAVPTNALGDVLVYGGIASASSTPYLVPGNLLREPSWEGTAILNAQYWGKSESIGGVVNGTGGCDGSTWPILSTGRQIWQDIETVPGQSHAIRFAIRASTQHTGSGGDGLVRVLWDGVEVGAGLLPAAERNFWHWVEATGTANSTPSRVTFVNVQRSLEMDAFSVVPMARPPQIVNQPTSASVISGGTAAFVVGASGSAPMDYHWRFNTQPLTTVVNPTLILESVAPNQAGTYQVVVSNAYGVATSAPVSLVVEAPTKPVILWQPYGDTVGVGGYFSFSVVAAGTLPLAYKWYRDGTEVGSETNRVLTFPAVDYTNAGTYTVRVENNAGIVWSLNAKLTVTNAIDGGGRVNFANRLTLPMILDAPVFDVDGVTRLNGTGFLAQLYGGPTLELLRPVGQPSPFRTGFYAGYFASQTVTLPTVPPSSTAVVQVRAWDAGRGSSYEEARATGGRFGKSGLFTVTVSGSPAMPANLTGLKSFSLQAGLPQLTIGRIQFVGREPRGIVVWSHQGEPGFRYLIEKSTHGFEWFPYVVVTNVSSSVTFTDSANSGSAVVFYRSRILD